MNDRCMFNQISNFMNSYLLKQQIRCKNTEISPNFVVWKYFGNAHVSTEFRAKRSKLSRNCAFLKNSDIRKLDEISVFCTVIDLRRTYYHELSFNYAGKIKRCCQ